MIIGKANSKPSCLQHLSDQEKDVLLNAYPNIIDTTCVCHKRLLIHGVVFSSLEYQRQSVTTCDYVMCFESGSIGFVTRYMGFCTSYCQSTQCSSSPCNVVAVAQVFESTSQNYLIQDQITGATANHVHNFDPLRYI